MVYDDTPSAIAAISALQTPLWLDDHFLVKENASQTFHDSRSSEIATGNGAGNERGWV
jgi:hypothetical protein